MEIFIRDVGSFVDATKFARVRSVTQLAAWKIGEPGRGEVRSRRML